MTSKRWIALLLLTLSVSIDAQPTDPNAAVFVDACARQCGAFETCFGYDGAEYCAPFCAPGRCNDTNETCIVEGHACDRAPCLPVAVCESKVAQPPINGTVDDPRCARACPMVDAPVCGSNGVSYANECFFEQAQCLDPSLTLAYAQLCDADLALNAQYNNNTVGVGTVPVPKPECDAIMCSSVNDPVCTTIGTMTNMCFLTKAQCNDGTIALLRRTACEDSSGLVAACPTTCTQEYVPVCASNGVVYGNDCFFRQAKCARQAYGELRARDFSECELNIGDSQGVAVDVAAWLVSTM